MHEMGIVVHLAKTLDEVTKEENIEKVGNVTLQVGEVSGIMTDYFEECWDYFKGRYPALTESHLILETIPAVTFCEHCEQNYPTMEFGKTCPYCGSGETYLLTGNECIIKEIEVQDEDFEDTETVYSYNQEDYDEVHEDEGCDDAGCGSCCGSCGSCGF